MLAILVGVHPLHFLEVVSMPLSPDRDRVGLVLFPIPRSPMIPGAAYVLTDSLLININTWVGEPGLPRGHSLPRSHWELGAELTPSPVLTPLEDSVLSSRLGRSEHSRHFFQENHSPGAQTNNTASVFIELELQHTGREWNKGMVVGKGHSSQGWGPGQPRQCPSDTVAPGCCGLPARQL